MSNDKIQSYFLYLKKFDDYETQWRNIPLLTNENQSGASLARFLTRDSRTERQLAPQLVENDIQTSCSYKDTDIFLILSRCFQAGHQELLKKLLHNWGNRRLTTKTR